MIFYSRWFNALLKKNVKIADLGIKLWSVSFQWKINGYDGGIPSGQFKLLVRLKLQTY